jgi:hypothetical protein
MQNDDEMRVESGDVGVNRRGLRLGERGVAVALRGLEVGRGPVAVEIDAGGVGARPARGAVGVHVVDQADGRLVRQGEEMMADVLERRESFGLVTVDGCDEIDAPRPPAVGDSADRAGLA